MSWEGAAALATFKGCAGVTIQRTGVDSPAALMKRNAFRPCNVLSPNPDEAGWLLMTFSASAVSGWRARNACIFAGSGLPVPEVGPGREEILVKCFRRAEREHR